MDESTDGPATEGSDHPSALKDRACDHVERIAGELLDVSHDIWEHPELGFEEHHAHDLLSGHLEAAGLETARNDLAA